MRNWLQLATRRWRAKPARSALAVLSIALGVGVVVWVTCCYESVRTSVTKFFLDTIGRSHIIVEARGGVWSVFDGDLEVGDPDLQVVGDPREQALLVGEDQTLGSIGIPARHAGSLVGSDH